MVTLCSSTSSSRAPSDIMSELPNNIIEKILMRLTQKEAVRTSILSTKWRYKWLGVPQVLFDYPEDHQKLSNSEKSNLVRAVYQALLLHRRPLSRFSFSVPDLDDFSDINHWLHFLSTIDIKDLTLRSWAGDQFHKLPCHLYSFQNLRHLNLYNCAFKPPTTFKGFANLLTLEFRKVQFAAERFGIFISNCPLLQRLKLEDCPHFFCLRISSPNLNYFSFNGTFDSVNLKNMPMLQVVSIALNGMAEIARYFQDRKTCNLIDIASSIPSIEDLSIQLYFLKFLAMGGVQKRLPKTLDHLRILNLSGLCFENIEEVSCALCLIKSSPNLEKITIKGVKETNVEKELGGVVNHLRDYEDISDCSLNKLTIVKMELVGGVQAELELMKFLLAASSRLEKFEILPLKEKSCCYRGFQILRELIRFRRASATAEIIYLDPEPDQ